MDEGFLVLLVIAVLSLPLLLLIFMVWTVKLDRRVRSLEDRSDELQRQLARFETGARPASGADQATTSAPAPAARAEPEPVATAPAKATPPDAPLPEHNVAGPPDQHAIPKAVVLRADRMTALTGWLQTNWIYAVSAVSLALAGLFLLQYGIEAGLLPPFVRVLSALGFGAVFIGAGEYLRRRWGDHEGEATAYLPSVFSGAGLVTLFGAVLAALHLYQLISPTTAFAGLALVAALGVALGWYSGPLLAAIGITGAFVAPFVVGGDSDTPQLFYGYFAIVVLAGLAIDAGRRWAWVSALSLTLAVPAGWLLWLGAGYPELFAAYLALLVLAAMAIPMLSLAPAHDGAATFEAFTPGRPRGWPTFPTRLVAGTVAAAAAGLAALSLDTGGGFWIATVALVAIFFALAVWADKAGALEDLALLPAATLLALPLLQALLDGDVFVAFRAAIDAIEGTPTPTTPFVLTAVAASISLAAAWRANQGARWPVAWAAGAAFAAPAMLVVLEVSWQPIDGLGAYPWALAAIAIATLMTGLALWFARVDAEDKSRIAGFVLAALAMIAFALVVILTKTALTTALAVVTLAAAALDRRFGLKPLAVAVQVGAIALAWRLVLDPGLSWAFNAPYPELTLGFASAVAALAGALWLYAPLARNSAKTVVESAVWSLGAIFFTLLLIRVIEDAWPEGTSDTHWTAGLVGTIWIIAMANQLWRTRIEGKLARLRWGLATIYGVIATLYLGYALMVMNPVVEGYSDNFVLGPPVVNTLALAYLLPGALLLALALRFDFLPRRLRLGLAVAGSILALAWLGLAIRHFWLGTAMGDAGVSEPELYSYTIALLLLGGGLLYQAIARRSAALRKLAMAVIAVTVAKVFLVDAAGLVGLLRVFSFLALGLSLAGLAFLNRWAAGQISVEEGKTP